MLWSLLTLSPFTLSILNCFVHAIIVTYSDSLWTLCIYLPSLFLTWSLRGLYPTIVCNNKAITTLSMHWFLRFSPVHLWTHRTIPHLYTLVPICHSGRWAFHHIVTVHSTTISLQMLYTWRRLLLCILTMMESLMQVMPDRIPPALTTDPAWSDVLTIWCMLEIKETLWLSITTTFQFVSILPTTTFHTMSTKWIRRTITPFYYLF